MTVIFAVVNQKGGVGKTTSAVTLAHGLAIRGYTVLLVDLDAQGNAADVLGLDKRSALYELLVKRDVAAAISPSGRERLDVILGDHRTVEIKQILAGTSFREYKLAEALREIEGYEVIILDVAPGVDVLQIGSLVACSHFIIPVALNHLAVVGASDALASTASLNQVGAFKGQFLGILPTMWERSTKESHAQLEILAGQFGPLVWPPVPLDVKAREAPAYGRTLWEYAPRTRALIGVQMGNCLIGGYVQVLQRLQKEVL